MMNTDKEERMFVRIILIALFASLIPMVLLMLMVTAWLWRHL